MWERYDGINKEGVAAHGRSSTPQQHTDGQSSDPPMHPDPARQIAEHSCMAALLARMVSVLEAEAVRQGHRLLVLQAWSSWSRAAGSVRSLKERMALVAECTRYPG